MYKSKKANKTTVMDVSLETMFTFLSVIFGAFVFTLNTPVL